MDDLIRAYAARRYAILFYSLLATLAATPLLAALESHGEWRIMISPDHPTFLRTKVHTHGNVPVAMAGTGIAADEFTSYGDTNAARSKLAFDEGWKLMPWFIGED